MKKTLPAFGLIAALAFAVAAPSFASSFDTAAGAKKPTPQAQQFAGKKKHGKKA